MGWIGGGWGALKSAVYTDLLGRHPDGTCMRCLMCVTRRCLFSREGGSPVWVPAFAGKHKFVWRFRHPGLVPGSTGPHFSPGAGSAERWMPEQARHDDERSASYLHHPGGGRGPIERTGLMMDSPPLRPPFQLGPGLRRGGGVRGDVSGINYATLPSLPGASPFLVPRGGGGPGLQTLRCLLLDSRLRGRTGRVVAMTPPLPHPENRTAPVPILQCSGTERWRYGFRDDASRTPARD